MERVTNYKFDDATERDAHLLGSGVTDGDTCILLDDQTRHYYDSDTDSWVGIRGDGVTQLGGFPYPETGAQAQMQYASSSATIANVMRGAVHILGKKTIASNIVVNTQSVGDLRVAIYQADGGRGDMAGITWDLLSDTAYTSGGGSASEEIALAGGPITIEAGSLLILHGTDGLAANISHWVQVIGAPLSLNTLASARPTSFHTTISSTIAAPLSVDPAGVAFLPSGLASTALGCYFT